LFPNKPGALVVRAVRASAPDFLSSFNLLKSKILSAAPATNALLRVPLIVSDKFTIPFWQHKAFSRAEVSLEIAETINFSEI